MTAMDIPTGVRALNGSEPHESWGGWQGFLASCEVRDVVEQDGEEIVFFGKTNCNYILFPGGRLVCNFGFHGNALMSRVREEGWRVVLQEIEEDHEEISRILTKLRNGGVESGGKR